MIEIEKVDVYGWEASIRGLRNPMNSWNKSDSEFSVNCNICDNKNYDCDSCPVINVSDKCLIGKNDLKLMKSLVQAGTDHRKFMRMINVTADIVAPLYWWKEFDTYKIGTVANSCSTMHKIADKEFTIDDFSHEHLMNGFEGYDIGINYNGEYADSPEDVLDYVICALNKCREKYFECTVSKYATSEEAKVAKEKYRWQMIQLLPSSYNQRRTVQLNYEVLCNMYYARKAHKLDEWVNFCKWIETLPYFKDICLGD